MSQTSESNSARPAGGKHDTESTDQTKVKWTLVGPGLVAAATGVGAVRCEFLVPVFWGLGTVVFRVVGTGPRGTSARAVSLSRLGWSGRWLYACRSLRYGFGGRC